MENFLVDKADPLESAGEATFVNGELDIIFIN